MRGQESIEYMLNEHEEMEIWFRLYFSCCITDFWFQLYNWSTVAERGKNTTQESVASRSVACCQVSQRFLFLHYCERRCTGKNNNRNQTQTITLRQIMLAWVISTYLVCQSGFLIEKNAGIIYNAASFFFFCAPLTPPCLFLPVSTSSYVFFSLLSFSVSYSLLPLNPLVLNRWHF